MEGPLAGRPKVQAEGENPGPWRLGQARRRSRQCGQGHRRGSGSQGCLPGAGRGGGGGRGGLGGNAPPGATGLGRRGLRAPSPPAWLLFRVSPSFFPMSDEGLLTDPPPDPGSARSSPGESPGGTSAQERPASHPSPVFSFRASGTAVRAAMAPPWLPAVGFTLAPSLGAFVGSYYVRGEGLRWYASLQKPSWHPPRWTLGPIWGTLYSAMG